MTFKEKSESWNVLEYLEYLNLYGDFYLMEMEKQILEANSSPTSVVFESGFLGNHFANTIQPKSGKNLDDKINIFKNKNPINSDLPTTTIDRFIRPQRQILVLLARSEKVNLMKIKLKTTLSLIIIIDTLCKCISFCI